MNDRKEEEKITFDFTDYFISKANPLEIIKLLQMLWKFEMRVGREGTFSKDNNL